MEAYDAREHGDVPLLDATATYDEESGAVTLFAVNRSADDDLELDVDLRALPGLRLESATTLAGPDGDVRATNTAGRPDAVRAEGQPPGPARTRPPDRGPAAGLLERGPAPAGRHHTYRPSVLRRTHAQQPLHHAHVRAVTGAGSSAVTAGSLLVAGCGKGPGSDATGVGGFTGKAYDGPKLSTRVLERLHRR